MGSTPDSWGCRKALGGCSVLSKNILDQEVAGGWGELWLTLLGPTLGQEWTGGWRLLDLGETVSVVQAGDGDGTDQS